jgi:hypothetical protein
MLQKAGATSKKKINSTDLKYSEAASYAVTQEFLNIL